MPTGVGRYGAIGFGEQEQRRACTEQFDGVMTELAADFQTERFGIELDAAFEIIDIDIDEQGHSHPSCFSTIGVPLPCPHAETFFQNVVNPSMEALAKTSMFSTILKKAIDTQALRQRKFPPFCASDQ
jgi:hypothetical protein